MRIRDTTSETRKLECLEILSFVPPRCPNPNLKGWGFGDVVRQVGLGFVILSGTQSNGHSTQDCQLVTSFLFKESFHLVDLSDPNPSLFIWQQFTSTDADYPGRYDHPARGIVGHKLHPLP